MMITDNHRWISERPYELQSCYMMVEKAQGHKLLNSRRNAAGIFDAGISNIQMSSAYLTVLGST